MSDDSHKARPLTFRNFDSCIRIPSLITGSSGGVEAMLAFAEVRRQHDMPYCSVAMERIFHTFTRDKNRSVANVPVTGATPRG